MSDATNRNNNWGNKFCDTYALLTSFVLVLVMYHQFENDDSRGRIAYF